MCLNGWPEVASLKQAVERGGEAGFLSPHCLLRFFNKNFLGPSRSSWRWAQVPDFSAGLAESWGSFHSCCADPCLTAWVSSSQLGLTAWPLCQERRARAQFSMRPGKAVCIVQKHTPMSLICHCHSGLQGMEDHLLVYTFTTWLQRGKPATDWSASGETQLLPWSASHGESRNVQGDFCHLSIW